MFLSTGFSLWIHDVSPKQNLVYLLKNFKHTHVCTHTDSLLHRAMVPSLLGNRDHFYRREFFCGWRGGWFRDDSSALHLLCTSFLFLLHQLHLRSSGIKSWRLGTPALFVHWLSRIPMRLPVPGGRDCDCFVHHCISRAWARAWHINTV